MAGDLRASAARATAMISSRLYLERYQWELEAEFRTAETYANDRNDAIPSFFCGVEDGYAFVVLQLLGA